MSDEVTLNGDAAEGSDLISLWRVPLPVPSCKIYGSYQSQPIDCRTSHPDSMNQIDLSNRHAVITGGAQGIGFSVARRFLSSGASVSLWDRDQQLLASAAQELAAYGTVNA